MIISLDRNALKDLIDKDPEFSLSLKNAVLAEVGRRFFKKDSRRVIAAATPEMFAKALEALKSEAELTARINHALEKALIARKPHGWSTERVPTAETQKIIEDAAKQAAQRIIDSSYLLVADTINKKIAERLAGVLNEKAIEGQIAARVDKLTEDYIHARVKTLFDAKMATLAKAMKG